MIGTTSFLEHIDHYSSKRSPTSDVVTHSPAPDGGRSLSSVDTGWRRVSKQRCSQCSFGERLKRLVKTDASGCLNRRKGLLKHKGYQQLVKQTLTQMTAATVFSVGVIEDVGVCSVDVWLGSGVATS